MPLATRRPCDVRVGTLALSEEHWSIGEDGTFPSFSPLSYPRRSSSSVESAYLGPGALAKSASFVEHACAMPALRLDRDALVPLFRDELWIALRCVLDEVDL